MKRIFTIYDYCLARLKARKPLLPFPFSRPKEHPTWRRKLRTALWREFGEMPQRVPLNARVLERKNFDHYVREKIVFQTERWMWAPAWVLIPKESPLRSKSGKLPALVAAHGHGHGKDPLVGETHGDQAIMDSIKQLNYSYALQAVKRGYFVIVPDWRTFGERSDPDDWVRRTYRDGCDVANNAVQYFGVHLLGLDVWDGMRAIDYLEGRSEVDAKRIGCLGLSFGGTMTTYLTAFDLRIKAACISGYVSTLDNAFGHRRGNFCGSQAMPGLARYGDIPDVALLAAPRPLCIEIGLKENCFYAPDMQKAARYVARGYKAIGAQDRLVIDAFPGKHEFSGRKAWPLFERWLGNP
ncbi:MAG: acetylxylan esterase [Verrucomicrobia bacterium]|nr:acetylxylan esterase [Verrucomicrobiota bacterium]